VSWDPITDSDDRLRLNGVLAPGPCTLTKLDDLRELTVVVPFGVTGGRIISRGAKLKQFEFKISLATAQHWKDWPAFQKELQRIPIGDKGKAHRVDWSPVNQAGIFAAMVEKISGPVEDGDLGLWIVTVAMTQWLPVAKPALSAPKEAEKVTEAVDPVNDFMQPLITRFVHRVNK
jgi:hypothetical protein